MELVQNHLTDAQKLSSKEKLEMAASKYLACGYVITSENDNLMTLVDVKEASRPKMGAAIPVGSMSAIAFPGRDDKMVTLRVNGKGIVEEFGYTLEKREKEAESRDLFIIIGIIAFVVVFIIGVVAMASVGS